MIVLSSSRSLPLYGWLALCALVTAQILLFSGIEVVRYWFFPLAWWPYILLIDGLVYQRKGSSLLTKHPREFLLLLPWSVCFWLIFELFNLALNNWHYVLVPENLVQRWTGYAVCYATVLPGLFETMELLEAYGLFAQSQTKPTLPPTDGTSPLSLQVFSFLSCPSSGLVTFFPWYGELSFFSLSLSITGWGYVL